MLGYNTNVKNDGGNYTISSGEIEIQFDASSAASLLAKRNQITDAMVKEVSETIKNEYEKYKENSFCLNREVEMECTLYNDGISPSLKEHWMKYKMRLRKEWSDKILEGNEQERLSPVLCFYYIVLMNENLESFFAESFIKDFIIMCINKPGIVINPDLFFAMYRFELIQNRVSETHSAFEAATQKIAIKKLTESQQIKFDLAKQEIKPLLQNLVDHSLINICVFNPPNIFIHLINTIIQDAYFQERIIANDQKGCHGYHFNLNLLLNIIGVLFYYKSSSIFNEGTTAKKIVKTMSDNLDAVNLSRHITKSISGERRYTSIDTSLKVRIEKIVKDFINNITTGS